MIRREEKPAVFRAALWEAHSKKCFYCGEPLRFPDVQLDHIIPFGLTSDPPTLAATLSEFGLPADFDLDGSLNLVSAHARCNRAKGDSLFEQTSALFFLERSKLKQALFTRLHDRYLRQGRAD